MYEVMSYCRAPRDCDLGFPGMCRLPANFRLSGTGQQGREDRPTQHFARPPARVVDTSARSKMNRLTDNKIVLVTRPTRLAELVIRFNTVSQARFYIEHQGADFSDYLREDETYHHALSETQTVLAQVGRVQAVDRSLLPDFGFSPEA